MNAARWAIGSSGRLSRNRTHIRAWDGCRGSGSSPCRELPRNRTSIEAHSLPSSSASALPAAAHQVDQVQPLVGPAHLGHGVLVVEALLGPLEVDGLVVDRPAVLAGGHPAGEERAAVPDPLDVEDDRHRVVAGQQEVGVEGVRDELRVDAAGRRPPAPARPPGRRRPAPAPTAGWAPR